MSNEIDHNLKDFLYAINRLRHFNNTTNIIPADMVSSDGSGYTYNKRQVHVCFSGIYGTMFRIAGGFKLMFYSLYFIL